MNSEPTNKRIAIIGCGYVGCALGEALLRAGHDVVGTTTSPQRVSEIEAVNGRVRKSGEDPSPKRKRGVGRPVACARGSDKHSAPACSDLGITPVVLEHAQTDRLHALLCDRDTVYLTLAAGRQRSDYREVYLEGVKNLLRAAEGTPVTRIVYTSSTQVYGQNDGSCVDECSPTEPQNENGRVLLAAEEALLDGTRAELSGEHASICATVVRLGGIHGPGRDLAERIRSAAGKQRTDGDAYVNLIHRDDIVTALVRLLDVAYRGVLNLTDDTPVKRRELYDGVINTAGLPPIRWTSNDAPPNLGKRVRSTLIKRTLGLTAEYPVYRSPPAGRSP